MSEASPAIAVRNLVVSLGGRRVLHDLSFDVPEAGWTGLVGPNGAGKSTLLRTLAGLLSPDRGEIRIAGRPLGGMSPRRIARTVHLLPQTVYLTVPFTVREVVAMGRHAHLRRFQPPDDHDLAIVQWSMEQTRITELADRPVTELSGGEKQRVLLARSLATEAPILLLDEPTTSLDILHRLEVLDLLREFARRGRTVVAALHDLNLARRACASVMLLHEGRIVAHGPAESALSPARIEEVFGIRAVLRGESRQFEFHLPESREASQPGARDDAK